MEEIEIVLMRRIKLRGRLEIGDWKLEIQSWDNWMYLKCSKSMMVERRKGIITTLRNFTQLLELTLYVKITSEGDDLDTILEKLKMTRYI